jgi:hypothetical protein
VTSFSGAMLGLLAVVLFFVAIGEIHKGHLGAAIVLGLLAVAFSAVAAAL